MLLSAAASFATSTANIQTTHIEPVHNWSRSNMVKPPQPKSHHNPKAKSHQQPKATTSQKTEAAKSHKPPKAKSRQKPNATKSQKLPKAKANRKPTAAKSPKLTESYQTTNGENKSQKGREKSPFKKMCVPKKYVPSVPLLVRVIGDRGPGLAKWHHEASHQCDSKALLAFVS